VYAGVCAEELLTGWPSLLCNSAALLVGSASAGNEGNAAPAPAITVVFRKSRLDVDISPLWDRLPVSTKSPNHATRAACRHSIKRSPYRHSLQGMRCGSAVADDGTPWFPIHELNCQFSALLHRSWRDNVREAMMVIRGSKCDFVRDEYLLICKLSPELESRTLKE
jgi:hypothetical protein